MALRESTGRSKSGLTNRGTLIAIVVLASFGSVGWLLFPTVVGGPGNPLKAQAKNDATQIATALQGYLTEYGHPPSPQQGRMEGDILKALTGSNAAQNPRHIVFIEVTPTKKGRSGLRDGIYVDPWGAPFLYVVAPDTNSLIRVGTNNVEVRKNVAVWNDPRLSPDAASIDDAERKRRSVTSWE